MFYEYTLVSSKGKLFKVPIDENDIVGERYGNVVVLRYDGYEYKVYNSVKRSRQKVHWYKVQCDCGKVWSARRTDLIHRNIKTCGKCSFSNKYGSLGNQNKRRTKNGSCKESNKDESASGQET